MGHIGLSDIHRRAGRRHLRGGRIAGQLGRPLALALFAGLGRKLVRRQPGRHAGPRAPDTAPHLRILHRPHAGRTDHLPHLHRHRPLVSTIIINEFRLTYGKLGPTEVRLILIAINTLFIYTPWTELHYELWGRTYGLFDFIGFVIACILFLLYVVQLVQDLRDLDKKDPLKPYHKE